ncbi:MAG: hypothetical protein Q8K32_23780 [Archangium sp.]|nr:hypothetical protein [Archangium sp.]
MRTCLFVLLLGVSTPGWAQDLPDSGLPDGSVEGGSAEGMTEENDPQGGPCLESKDCAQGFACSGARCVPVKPKNVGCTSAPAALVAAGAVFLALRRRRS